MAQEPPRGRDRLEDHDRWEDAHSAMRHDFIDRHLAPHWLDHEHRFHDIEARLNIQERRGDRFDTVIATIRVQAMILGVLVTAFGSAILYKLGVI